jgi:hypothetical protein
MGVSEKYSYVWTLFKGLPFGIFSVVIGLNLFLKTPSNVNELEKITGCVEWYGEKSIYMQEIDATGSVFAMKVDSKLFYNERNKVREKLQAKIPNAYANKREVTIWFVPQNKIKQLSIDGDIVVSYKPYGTAIFFICFGVLITVGAIIYAIKYKSDL